MMKAHLFLAVLLSISGFALSTESQLRQRIAQDEKSRRLEDSAVIDPKALFGNDEVQVVPVSTIFNQLTETFLPSINSVFQSVLSENFDPYDANVLQHMPLGEIGFANGLCSAAMNVTFGFGLLSGLGSTLIETLEMIPGSEEISGGLLTKTRFSAIIDLITMMEDQRNIVAKIVGGIEAGICGMVLEQFIGGSAGIFGAKGKLQMKFSGQINLLNRNVEVDEVDVLNADVEYDEMDVDMEDTEHEIQSIVAAGEEIRMHTFLSQQLNATDDIRTALDKAVTSAMDKLLPFRLTLA